MCVAMASAILFILKSRFILYYARSVDVMVILFS